MQQTVQAPSTTDPAVLTVEDLEALDLAPEKRKAADARAGGVIAVRIFFKVSGPGSFTAGSFNTANGATNAWVRPGQSLTLAAHPASGATFDHWELNGQWAGDARERTVGASRGLEIKAVFQRARATRESRGYHDTWTLTGPDSEYEGYVHEGYTELTYVNDGPDMSVEMWLNDRQLGSIGPGTSHTVPCEHRDVPKVIASPAAKPGDVANGEFYME